MFSLSKISNFFSVLISASQSGQEPSEKRILKEIWEIIFSDLSLKDMGNIALTSRFFNDLTNENFSVWKKIAKQYNLVLKTHKTSYKDQILSGNFEIVNATIYPFLKVIAFKAGLTPSERETIARKAILFFPKQYCIMIARKPTIERAPIHDINEAGTCFKYEEFVGIFRNLNPFSGADEVEQKSFTVQHIITNRNLRYKDEVYLQPKDLSNEIFLEKMKKIVIWEK